MIRDLSDKISGMQQEVAVLTTSRSEYYQLRSLLENLKQSPLLSLNLLVSGSHLSSRFGKTERHIKEDGFFPYERLPILLDDDSRLGCALTAGLAVQMIALAIKRNETDILVILGDRYEVLAAALAATCLGVPIAHIHGGERTDGVIDDACRHAITKLSSLHFVSTEVYLSRVIQMGESPDKVFAVGAPLVDEIMSVPLLSSPELAVKLGIQINEPVALVVYHPTTNEHIDEAKVYRVILESVANHYNTIIVTAPNHDPGYLELFEVVEKFTQNHNNAKLFENLGSQKFFSVMSIANIMIGNSSSGIHEAASFSLPVINIGSRQENRLRPRNVIDCKTEKVEIEKAISKALSKDFQNRIADLENPYGDGSAGKRIVNVLEQFVPFRNTLQNTFKDNKDVLTAITKWKQNHG